MAKAERQQELVRIMLGRGEDTMQNLATDLGVDTRTIRRDILELSTADNPIPFDTRKGNGGGVILKGWRHPHKNIFSQEQQLVLSEMLDKADERQTEVLLGLLNAYGKLGKEV